MGIYERKARLAKAELDIVIMSDRLKTQEFSKEERAKMHKKILKARNLIHELKTINSLSDLTWR